MEDKKQVIVVIPTYEPNNELIRLIQEIKHQTLFKIIVVDDGSGEMYASIFEEVQKYAEVIAYKKNRGKGSALKTAFSYIQKKEQEEAIIVTVDSDGQHQVKDMMAVVEEVQKRPEVLVLGSRIFDQQVPAKSRWGNKVTSYLFELLTGVKVKDTQTGLRAFDAKQLSYLLKIPGDRYEYEMNMLMSWAKDKKKICEKTIETIYMDGNAGSHFHPVKDSLKIYKEILRFSCSSLIAFFADYTVYVVLSILTKGMPLNLSIGISNVVARVMSATLNYNLNRKFVFKSNTNVFKTALQYAVLATSILILNTLLLTLLVHTYITNQLLAKIVVELILFIVSGLVQKKIIFKSVEKADEIGESR